MEANPHPKVSVLVPVYNMESYLEECLEALRKQTLSDIEIICIDDGSTDSCPDILARAAADDARVRVISKPNSGYGASMNRGLAAARGDYIGIVEPDDYPDRVMFEKLYAAASEHGCDVVKCNYYEHYDDHEQIVRIFDGFDYGSPFDPADLPHVICTVPAIWAGIYRRRMLEFARISFRETPGASFQDTGFTLKAWFAARRALLVRRPLLHYRMDNPGSSVKTADKAYAVCDELAEAESFLRERPVRAGAFAPWLHVDKWGKYRWNFNRIDRALRPAFAERMRAELAAARDAGELSMELFDEVSRMQVARLLAEGADAFSRAYGEGVPDVWEADPAASEASAAAVALARGEFEAPAPPAVTVMVAAFNCERYIGECLRSLAAQTFGDFEAIVVDDASTDVTVACAREAIAGDARFTIVERAANGGPGAARNEALARARGTAVMYVDADDLLAPEALERIVARMVRQNLDELYFSATSFYEDAAATEVMSEDFGGRIPFEGVATGRELFTFFSERNQYFAQGALRAVRRELLEREGIRFPEGIIHEDVLYGFRILAASRASSFLDEPVYLRRQRAGSIMDSSRRSVANVRGHVEAVLAVRRWARERAIELDAAFLAAIGRETARWSQFVACDWEREMDDAERAEFLGGLSPADREEFLAGIIGPGSAAEHAAAEWRESRTYRLGDAIATVPRTVRDRIGAAVGRARALGRK